MQKIQWFTAGGGGGGGTSYWTADGDNIYNNNSGYVGVGTATPLAKLEVQGNTTDGWIRLSTSSGNPFITSTNNLSFKTGGASEILYLRNPDRVGINIGQNANANLHVRSTNDTSGTYALIADSTTGAGLFVVRGDGNVGIGTTAPTEKLEVVGNVKATDSLRFGTALRSSAVSVTGTEFEQSLQFYIAYRSDGVTVAENRTALMLGGQKFFEPRTTNASKIYCFNTLSVVPINTNERAGTVSFAFGNPSQQYPTAAVSLTSWATIGSTTDRYLSVYGYFGTKFSTVGGNEVMRVTASAVTIGVSANKILIVNGRIIANDGLNNVIVGANAGTSITTGSNNELFGRYAGESLTTGSGNVFLGYQAGRTLTTESNRLVIANSSTVTPLIYGEFDNTLIRVNGDFESTGGFGFSGQAASAVQTGYKATSSSSNRIFDSSTVTLADLANVMANLVNDLVAKGIIAE